MAYDEISSNTDNVLKVFFFFLLIGLVVAHVLWSCYKALGRSSANVGKIGGMTWVLIYVLSPFSFGHSFWDSIYFVNFMVFARSNSPSRSAVGFNWNVVKREFQVSDC